MVQRVLNTLRFLWLLFRAMVDGLTQWLDACTREHANMSSVLRLERYVLTRRLATVSTGTGGTWGQGGGQPHGDTDPAAGSANAPRGPG